MMRPSDDAPEPLLSVIVITAGRPDLLSNILQILHAQKVRPVMELVLVATDAAGLDPDHEHLQGYAACRFLSIDDPDSSSLRAAGVRAARAQVVAFVEDHCLPEPGWAEALIARHREPWAAVGPVIVNGNPDDPVSWANLLVEYGDWVEVTEGGPRAHLPGHNSSYKRDVLMALGDELAPMLNAETSLHWHLGEQGHRLYLEPAARSRHFNYSLLRPSLALRFYVGRLFASSRSRGWSLAKRLAYFAASPLIPLIRLFRVLRTARRIRRHTPLPAGLGPILFLLLLVDGLGETTGYVAGPGRSLAYNSEIEFDRERHMRSEEHGLMDQYVRSITVQEAAT